jgi:hypothetical protein
MPGEAAPVRRHRALISARLALLGAAGLTVLLYALSPAAGQSPWFNARYLVGIWLALPAVLAPLVSAKDSRRTRIFAGVPALGMVALAVLFATLFAGTVETLAEVPATQQFDRWQAGFIQQMLRRHITHIYTDYWTCDRVAFQSDERLICSVLEDHLGPGLNRYTPYDAIVRSDPGAAYAFPTGSTPAEALADRMARGRGYQRFLANGYTVYLPVRAVR